MADRINRYAYYGCLATGVCKALQDIGQACIVTAAHKKIFGPGTHDRQHHAAGIGIADSNDRQRRVRFGDGLDDIRAQFERLGMNPDDHHTAGRQIVDRGEQSATAFAGPQLDFAMTAHDPSQSLGPLTIG